ncbi:MAG: DMT family transporter [Helicobacteraceae bacterium]
MKYWLLLGVCIVLETVATSFLKLSEGFSKPVWGVVSILMFSVIFYVLSLIFKHIPVGIAYAVWSGLGIVLIALVSVIFLGQSIDKPGILGIALIVLGVIVINLFSKFSH